MRSSRAVKYAANLLLQRSRLTLNPTTSSFNGNPLKHSPVSFVPPRYHHHQPRLSPFSHPAHPSPHLFFKREAIVSGGCLKEVKRITQLALRAYSGGRGSSQLGLTVQQRLQRAYRIARGGNSENIIYALIGANVFVYGMWQTANPYFMARHFQVSVESLQNGRWHTALTSAFSHKDIGHLLVNMMGLYFFGPEMARIYGPKRLLALYVAAGCVGSVSHVLYCKYLVPWREGIPQRFFNPLYTPSALGASAAVNAIILLSTIWDPMRIVYLNFLIPVPAAILAVFFVGRDFAGVFQEGSRTAHAGHLGGTLVGALFWARYRFRR